SDDYGFRNAGNAQFIDSINIYLGQTQATFRYHDRTASYSGVSPSSNTAEGERPGYWQLEAKSGIMQPAIHQLQMNPYEIAKVTFGNEQRSITAGKIVNSETGLNQSFKVELRDMFDNPSIATATVEVLLSTANRQASIFSDSFCFAASSAMSGAFPPIFESTVSFVTIPLDYYSATFYYLDTMASSGYEVALPTKPVIGLAVPERPTWQPSEQSVIVAPDTADRISVRDGIGQTIMAGATSQMFVMSLDDRFGNPTPVKSERVFGITSTSGGDVKMSSPNDDDFIDQPGTATLALGESTTSFYIIDTLISETTHQLVVDEIDSQGWTAAISSYTVVAAPPDHVVFVTDSRRLITGTTVQYSDYELGITTSTQIRVGLRDIYENATTTDTDVNVRFIADKNSTYGGISGDEEVSASNPNWQVLKTNPLNVTIYAGYSDTGIYIWDTVVGTSTISALATITADSITLPEVNQEEYITPNKATHFTLEHLFTSANPLPVGANGTIVLKARDEYGNVASGDAVNGQYYLGKIDMVTNTMGSADIRDGVNNTTYYTFTEGDSGVRNLDLKDTFVEELKINVTDYNNGLIFGYTDDSDRGMPVGSSDDVILSGLIVTPTDMSPEDPLSATKISMGLTKTSLYQGDGAIEKWPSSVPMIRMSMYTSPVGAPAAFLKSLQVKSSGTLIPSDIVQIGFYSDRKANGLFDGESIAYGVPGSTDSAQDLFISSGVYDTDSQSWFFDNLNIKGSTNVHVSNSPKNFFLSVVVSTLAATPRTFGLSLDNPSFVVLYEAPVGVAYNNFSINTATSPVKNQPALINIESTDLGAWWQPEGKVLGQYPDVSQGAFKVGMLKIKAWTDNFLGTISGFKIIKSGSGSGVDVQSMRVYLDASGTAEDNWKLGDGDFNPNIDMEITDVINPPTHDPADTELFKLIFDKQSYGEIGTSTKTFFIAYDFSPDAIEDLTHGASLEKAGIMLIGADVPASLATINSSVIPVIATSDTVKLVAINRVLPNDFSKPTSVTQNDINRPVARLTIKVNDDNGSAIWKGLKLDRWLTASENSGNPLYNKASDVSRISLWHDSTGDGLLQTTTTVKDTEVVLLTIGGRQFPIDIIASSITATATEMKVKDIQKYFPSDSPFDRAPGRLIINDEQTDPDMKEVVYFSTVNILGNTFGGLTRGAEGTTARDWSSGTYVSGQAILPIVDDDGSLKGQVIYDVEKDYFVTYDIEPLATVSSLANIGLSMRTTHYFKFVYPKQMSDTNIGVTPPGKSVSLIGKIKEHDDKVMIKAADTITGDTLQQKEVDRPILSFTAEADQSDAILRWLLVYATGSVVAEGSAMN
ncbi:MAG: hypothetical protein KAJ48_09880, partial [Elusimicrobiales bacterium]|nr:hypothetical protein [Elusimicrobiales bacterium]